MKITLPKVTVGMSSSEFVDFTEESPVATLPQMVERAERKMYDMMVERNAALRTVALLRTGDIETWVQSKFGKQVLRKTLSVKQMAALIREYLA